MKNNLKRILSGVLAVIVCLTCITFSGYAHGTAGIKNNGLGGINIDIYSAPYNDSRWYAYGAPYGSVGCTWFVGARVMQLTGKGSYNTQNPSNWYYSYGKSLGFTTGTTPRAKSVICWSGHVAILEKIEGNTAYISEGGNTASAGNDYCQITTKNVNSINSSSNFLGYVYLGVSDSLIDFWDISNPDNSPAWIDTSGTPTISGARKFWFKETDPDTNYYIDIFVDGTKVIANGSSDAYGYIGYVIETGALSNGLHTITADLYDSRAKYTASKSFYVNNLIWFHSISDPDNTGWLEDPSKTPTISGTKRIWFREVDPDTNYYIDLYIDDKKVVSNGSSDPNGFFSFVVDTSTLYNCEHTVRAELFDSKTYYSAVKHFVAYNDKSVVTFDATGGKVDISQGTFVCGKNYGTLPVPTRTGYVFDGWYTSKNGGTKVTDSTKVINKNAHTLYAKWLCNHSYKLSVTKESMCTSTGFKKYTCTICGETKTETVPALGHSFNNYNTVDIPATCTQEGSQSYHCSRCDATTGSVAIPKTGHTYGDWYISVQPTETQTGVKTRQCTVCGNYETEIIEKLEPTMKAPEKVTGIKAKAASSYVTLSWNEDEAATGYRIYKYNPSNKKYEKVKDVHSTSYKVTGLKAGTSYSFKIRAYNKTEYGTFWGTLSDVYKTKTTYTSNKPAQVTGLKMTARTATTVSLKWDEAAGAQIYYIFKYNKKQRKYIEIGSTKGTTFKAKKLLANTDYMFAVQAGRTVGKKEYYGKVSSLLSVKTDTDPAQVTGLKVTAKTSSTVSLKWNKADGAQIYYVFKYNKKAKRYIEIGSTKGTTFKAKKLLAHTDYMFAVQSAKTVNRRERYGKVSSLVSVKTK